jgi:hypothetical protein
MEGQPPPACPAQGEVDGLCGMAPELRRYQIYQIPALDLPSLLS